MDTDHTAIYCQADLNYATSSQRVTLFDGRDAGLDWQVNGFELLAHAPAVDNWADDREIETVHYAEMAALARSLTGCRHVLIGEHIRRDPESARVHPDYAPIQFAHSDFTADYGDRIRAFYQSPDGNGARTLARAGLKPSDVAAAEDLLILQFWRNVGPPVMNLPLAFCDATTVSEADLQPFHVPSYAGGDFAFNTFGLTAPPASRAHRWYVFPAMRLSEVVTFRTFDSRCVRAGKPYWTPHTAFVDPTVAGAAERRSIELRATCLF
jgi:hypothetical protein